MKALVFGINGQDGYYLNELLISKGYEVIGVSRSGNWVLGDVSNFYEVEYLIKTHKPELIIDLAANSTTRHDVLFENHATICNGSLNILEAVKLHSPASKIFLSGSGLQFTNKGLPIIETDPFEATSAYAVSRIHTVYAARYYRSFGIKAYIGYFFNHESPKRPERHISKKIACAAKRISLGNREKITLGDITVKKEWTYAGDTVNAILLLLQQESIFETVIGSGLGYTIQQWLEVCFNIIGKDWNEYFETVSNFKPEYEQLVSDPKTLFQLGWKQEVDFENLAKMMVETA